MKNKTLFISGLAIISALFIAFVLLLMLGKNPITFLMTLLTVLGDDPNGNVLTSFVSRLVPLTFTALGVAFAFRTGLFNIGAEGQFGMGIVGAILIGSIPGIPAPIHILLVLLGSFTFGALWGLMPGFLRAYFSVHEVVLSIMMNYIALYLIKGLFLPALSNPMKPYQALSPQPSATLESVFGAGEFLRVPLNYWVFFLIMLAAVGVFYFIINKTTLGFELRAGGFNEHSARYAGMKSKRNIMLSLTIAGGFAGLGGAFYVLNGTTVATSGFVHTGFGFDGLAAALLGGSTAIGTLVGSGVFGYLSAVNIRLQQRVGIPKQITDMIMALILFFIASAYGFEWLRKKLKQRREKKKPHDTSKPFEFSTEGEGV
jgi:simple sugar transport system permease protein